MKKEDKELLLKDLSARLPYEVKCDVQEETRLLYSVSLDNVETVEDIDSALVCLTSIDNVKPYLRPMSSMTKEELEEYNGTMVELPNEEYLVKTLRTVDFCNKHHLDYRGLIPKDLALEAPEGMYA